MSIYLCRRAERVIKVIYLKKYDKLIELVKFIIILFRLSPYSFDVSPSGMESTSITHDSVPIGAIPILAGCSHDYRDFVSNVIRTANQIYRDFIKTGEGFGFNGRVYFIGLYIKAYFKRKKMSKLNVFFVQ